MKAKLMPLVGIFKLCCSSYSPYFYFTKNALRNLVAYRNPDYPLPPSTDWGIPLKYYLYAYQNPTNKREDAEEYVAFIKDDFAKKLSEADSFRDSPYAENFWLTDAEFIIRKADVYSSSMLLYSICQKMLSEDLPKDWTETQMKAMILAQLERDNGHHAYAWLLLQDGIFTDEAERWELIELYLALAPKNVRFVVPFLKWGKKAALKRTRSVAKSLLEVEGQVADVICTALNFLDRDEAKLFAKELLDKDGQVADVICVALNLLDRDEAKLFAKELLDVEGQHPFVICTALNLLDREEAKSFARKLLLEEKRQEHQIICTVLNLNLLDREEAKPFAKELLDKDGQVADVICVALNLLDRDEAKLFAKELLDVEGQHPFVICTALNLLDRDEAKLFAKELLEVEGQVADVICTALKLLDRDEAKTFARKLLDVEGQHPFVICTALNILNKEEASPFARKLLLEEKRQEQEIICTVLNLNLLDREEAKPFAKELLDVEGQHPFVICTALNILNKEEASPFARKLLLEEKRQEQEIICTVLNLNLLDSEEAKPFARKLLEVEGQVADVICTALKLLDRDKAKPFARKLLLEEKRQEQEIICTVLNLNLLDQEEAKPFAWKLIKEPNQTMQLRCAALHVLGKEAADYAARVLDNWKKEPFNVVLRSLNILPKDKKTAEIITSLLKRKRKTHEYFRVLAFPFPAVAAWQQEVENIVRNWKYKNRRAVASVLPHYFEDPYFLKQPCFEILGWWKRDIEYQRRKFPQSICTDHILIALGHPHLRAPAGRVAAGMLLDEKEHPGFLGEKLLQAAEDIVNDGIYPDWENEEN
ncbi:MAG: hypothetical protein ACL93V_15200 [Candidatus Electrothrix sp. YB6]